MIRRLILNWRLNRDLAKRKAEREERARLKAQGLIKVGGYVRRAA